MIRLLVSLVMLIVGPIVTKEFKWVFYSTAAGDLVGGIVGLGFMIATMIRYNRLRK